MNIKATSLVACLTYFFTPNIEGRSSETSVNFHRTTRRYILEHVTFHSYKSQKLKPAICQCRNETQIQIYNIFKKLIENFSYHVDWCKYSDVSGEKYCLDFQG
jgi:hypothetical protein